MINSEFGVYQQNKLAAYILRSSVQGEGLLCRKLEKINQEHFYVIQQFRSGIICHAHNLVTYLFMKNSTSNT